MADYTCGCVPANRSTVASLVASAQSNINSVVERVTDLEEDVEDLDERVTALEGVQESAFILVDNEAEFDAALLLGKHILLRGEGNGGEISLTSTKTIGVNGTRIWGYGYAPNSVEQFSKIKFDHPNLPAYGAGNLNGLIVRATDVELGGFEIHGNDSVNLSDGSYFAIVLPTDYDPTRLRIRDLVIHNVNRGISKEGNTGATNTTDLFVERVYVHTTIGNCVSIQQGLYNAKILHSKFIPKLQGGTAFPLTKGLALHADIRDALIMGNYVENCTDEGIELTSTLISGDDFNPMLRNKVIGNTVKSVGKIGISYGYPKDSVIQGNVVEGAGTIGIESSAGSTLGETGDPHNTLITGNTVRDLAGGVLAVGISVDKTYGDLVIGNRVIGVEGSGVSSDSIRGLWLYDAKHALVSGNHFYEVNGTGIYVLTFAEQRMNGQHVIQDNYFRVSSAMLKAVFAISVFDTRCVVRNNVSWEPSAGPPTQRFYVNNNLPATVYSGFDWTAEVHSQNFLESNLRLTY